MKKRSNLTTILPLPRAFGLLLAGLALVAAPLSAQEEEEEPAEDDDRPLISEDVFGGGTDPNEEMKRLFHEVEAKLLEIDIQLADAGAGDLPLSEVGDSGLEKLLRDSQASGREVLSGIDRILQLAEEMGQKQQGQGSGPGEQPQPGGESPLDQPRDNGPQGRENTPKAPGEGEQKPQPGDEEKGEKPGGDKPGQQPEGEKPGEGEDPNSPGANPPGGENQQGDPNNPEGGPGVPRSEDANRWGELPQRVQETFRNQGRDDLPLQYRDWIDSYYRRLNKAR